MAESKTILSWDVGIKNLAYCKAVFYSDHFNILSWDVINLSDEVSCKIEKCKLKAIYNLNNVFYCKKHYSEINKKNNKSSKICANANKISINDLTISLFRHLDEKNKDFYDVNEVIIENQPSFKNPRMKTVAIILYSYFMLKGVHETNNLFHLSCVKFIAPSKKLSVSKNNTKEILNKEENSNKVYSITKKLGKLYCQALISEYDKTTLLKTKKKDDLCDCFLQAFSYFYKKIPENFALKLDTVCQSSA